MKSKDYICQILIHVCFQWWKSNELIIDFWLYTYIFILILKYSKDKSLSRWVVKKRSQPTISFLVMHEEREERKKRKSQCYNGLLNLLTRPWVVHANHLDQQNKVGAVLWNTWIVFLHSRLKFGPNTGHCQICVQRLFDSVYD